MPGLGAWDELKRDPRERQRFLSEAKLVAALHHPNIVDIYAIVEEGDEVYLVFEHIAGRTVHEIIAAPIEPERHCFGAQACSSGSKTSS